MLVEKKAQTVSGPEQGSALSQDHLVDPLTQPGTQPSGVPAGALAWTGGKADMPQGGGSNAPADPATVSDAQSDEQEQQVRSAIQGARDMGGLAMGIAGRARSDEQAAALVAGSFNDSSQDTVLSVSSVLNQTMAGLSSAFNVQVESWMWWGKSNTAGYVYGGPLAAYTDIHLAPRFFELGRTQQAGVIFHEGTHKWAGTGDKAYMGSSGFSSLSPADALNNADSYTHLGQGLFSAHKAAEREADKAEQLRVATGLGAELIQATLDGRFEGRSESTFTTEEGVVLEYTAVYQGMQAYLQAQHPELAAEIAAKMEDPAFDSYADYTSESGVLVPYLLVTDLGIAGGFEGW